MKARQYATNLVEVLDKCKNTENCEMVKFGGSTFKNLLPGSKHLDFF